MFLIDNGRYRLNAHLDKKRTLRKQGSMGSGSVLLSRAVASQVPSALKGLTTVFGMGTGGSLSLLPPEYCEGSAQPLSTWSPVSSVYNRYLPFPGEPPHIARLSLYHARTLKTAHPDFFHLISFTSPALGLFGSSPRPISITRLQTLLLFHR